MSWLEDLLTDRERMMKLMWLAFWASVVLMVIGYAIIAMDLLA